MKLSTSIIGRIGIIAGAVASVHILSSIWWTLFAVSRGYAYEGAWNTLADYLLGGMYRGVDFRMPSSARSSEPSCSSRSS